MKYQPPDRPVNISLFPEHPEYDGLFVRGAREKRLCFSPDECDIFLKQEHLYLFKESWHRHPKQYWSEIAAYKIGSILGVNVPPTFVALRKDPLSSDVVCGALIEWFYNPDDPNFLRYRDAGDFLEVLIEGYDRKYGKQHNLQDNFEILRAISELKNPYIVPESIYTDFVLMLLFDGIIGNTDRHQDNWGIIYERFDSGTIRILLSPAFDNGTSLGYEIVDRKLSLFQDRNRRLTYIAKGYHHMRGARDGNCIKHFEFVDLLLRVSENVRQMVKDFFSVDLDEIKDSLFELTSFDVPVPLDRERANFMYDLVCDRINEAKRLIAKYDI